MNVYEPPALIIHMANRYRRSLFLILISLQCSCHSWHSTTTLPVRNIVELEQLVVYSDFKLAKHHRLLKELNDLRTDVSTKLDIPVSDEPIHVYIFESNRQFAEFMQKHYPTLPPRRAFFVETDMKLSIYAYRGDRVAEDLRHETSHGYLHSVIPNIPLWVDEGLAENFEVSRGHRGISQNHIDSLLDRHHAGTWKPDLERLEKLDGIETMTQLDYAESWAWIHLLLETTPQSSKLIKDYLQELRNDPDDNMRPLSVRIKKLLIRPESVLIAHLKALDTSKKTK